MGFFFIGHRGTRKGFDENTKVAFDAAINATADYIEFDIRRTKDNQLIVFHDETIDRVTNGSGYINTLSYRELNKYRTKNDNQEIPLLTDILIKYKDKINYMIELKEIGIQESILDFIYKNDLSNKCIISGRNYSNLIDIKKKNSDCLICYNITKGEDLKLDTFLAEAELKDYVFPLDMISLKSSQITKSFINICHKKKIYALSWDFMTYINPLEKIKELIRIGIDGLLFDDHKNIPLIKKWMENNFIS